MKYLKWILFLLLVLLLLWTAFGYFATSSIEEPEYTVIDQLGEVEIREYAPMIIAEAEVSGDFGTAINRGFGIVAGYIFGGNSVRQEIAMTAPVVSESSLGQEIAMTVPVLSEEGEGNTWKIAFVMPSRWTLETLPVPDDSRVNIREIPAQKKAVIQFSWFGGVEKQLEMLEEVYEALDSSEYELGAGYQAAFYDPPLTPPWMRRNEILVDFVD